MKAPAWLALGMQGLAIVAEMIVKLVSGRKAPAEPEPVNPDERVEAAKRKARERLDAEKEKP